MKLRKMAAVVATGVAVGGCERGQAVEQPDPNQLGKQTIALCASSTPGRGTITPQVNDLEGDVEVSDMYHHIPENAFSNVEYMNDDAIDPVQTLNMASFIKVNVDDDEMCYTVTSPTKSLNSQSTRALLAAVLDNSSLLAEASKSGKLAEVDFGLIQKDWLGGNITDAPGYIERPISPVTYPMIGYPIDPRGKLSAANVRTMLRHETLHALMDTSEFSAGNMDENHGDTKQRFMEACAGLRHIALEQTKVQINAVRREMLDLASSELQAGQSDRAKVIMAVANGLMSGNGQGQPTSGNYYASNLGYGNIVECKLLNPWHQALREMERIGVKSDDEDYISVYGDRSDKITSIMISWDNIVRNHTIYKFLREGTYINDDRSEGFGHPYDNWDEAMASILTVALTYPDDLTRNVKGLSEEQQEAILDMLTLAAEALNDTHPDLPENQQLEALLGQFD